MDVIVSEVDRLTSELLPVEGNIDAVSEVLLIERVKTGDHCMNLTSLVSSLSEDPRFFRLILDLFLVSENGAVASLAALTGVL